METFLNHAVACKKPVIYDSGYEEERLEMNRHLTLKGVTPIKLPPEPEPHPDSDPLAAAVVAEMTEEGYERATIAGLIRRAGVSREEFDCRFDSLDACALDTYERLIADFERRLGSAFNQHRDWPSALRAAAYACADWLSERPGVISFGTAEVLKMRSELARVRREEAIAFCVELVDRGREVAPDPDSIPSSAPVVATGSIAQLLTHRVQEGAKIDPYKAVPEVMNRIVTQYLGTETGEAEWTAPPP
jgi:AcrR family transcriptional regulator